ncbi:MAG: alpha/beta hydrolase [SAR86 cluster bacterium]|nr:alpha/beta hydrolase [SAR86 cluster bacterium]MDA0899961.1 alpha/beta hydrolase [Pseudomonadota bacterium]MDA1056681.1 alpha/beta hydrolase [Pseudomonadota bacterium]
MKQLLFILFFVQFFFYPNSLDLINSKKNVFESGLVLVQLKNGLHFLEEEQEAQKELVIAIHGGGTLGYEWVYPLNQLNSERTRVAFFRWNPISATCANEELRYLKSFIGDISSQYEKITILGHSLGGILLARLIEDLETNAPVEAHIIASPLKGIEPTNSLCDYQPPMKVSNNVVLYEWRTQKKLDGIFMALPYDPQIVEIENSTVTRLPEKYKENKLGHNWSISWVVDKISN